MRTRIAVIALAALALASVLLSCNGTGAIYSTIETEKKTPVSVLNSNITVLDIVNIPGADPLPYFVAAGAIFNGTQVDPATGAIGWPNEGQSPVAVAPPQGGALCQSLSLAPNYPTDNALYGGFFTSDGSVMGLYRSVPNGSTYTFQGATQITGGGTVTLVGKQIVLLQVAGGKLFVVAASLPSGASSYTYELDYYDPSLAAWAQVQMGLLTTLPAPVTGVGFSGGTYFVTVAASPGANWTTRLYTGASLSAALTDSTGALGLVSSDLRGVTVDTVNGNVLIPGDNGAVYFSTNAGGVWSHIQTGDQVSNGNNGTIGFLTVSQEVGSAGPVYLVGSDGNGFYFLTLTPGVTLARFSDVTQTGLYQGAVRRILVDNPRSNLVFFGMASTGPGYYSGVSEGLWRNFFDPVAGSAPVGFHLGA